MSLRDRLVERGKQIASSGVVVRLISNDRVMAIATGELVSGFSELKADGSTACGC